MQYSTNLFTPFKKSSIAIRVKFKQYVLFLVEMSVVIIFVTCVFLSVFLSVFILPLMGSIAVIAISIFSLTVGIITVTTLSVVNPTIRSD